MANANDWAVLSDSTRRSVFEALRHGPASVSEIARTLPVTRPAVSQHLKALKDAGLVRSTPDGARRIYEVDPQGLAAMRSWLDQFWDDALARFKTVAEKPGSPPSKRKAARQQ